MFKKFYLTLVLLLMPLTVSAQLFEPPIDNLISRLTSEGGINFIKDDTKSPDSPSVCVTPPANLVSWYRAEGNTSDAQGANNGTLGDSAIFAAGKVGQAFQTVSPNGSTVSVPDSASLNFTNAFTIEMWVSPTQAGTPGGSSFFACKGDCGSFSNQSYSLVFSNTQQVFFRVGNSSTFDSLGTPTILPLNTFSHIAGTYDGSTMRVYVNGVLDNSKTTTTGTLADSSQPFIIGGSTGSGNALGIYDETSLYNRALTGAEIVAIFNAGSEGKCGVPLQILPTTANVATGGTINFTATGGAIPRTFSIVTNNSGGSINPTTGVYTAGATLGADTVTVTDAANQASDATDTILIRSSNGVQRSWTGSGRYRLIDVDVQNMGGTSTKTVFSGTNSGGNNASWVFNSGCPTALSISPLSANVLTGATQTFTAAGGSPNYTFSILTNNSGAIINPTTGLYTAGATANVTDTVRVTDSFGSTADAIVNVIPSVNRLAFVVQPSNTNGGDLIVPFVRVAIQDAGGNTITTAANAITIAIGNNPNNGTLFGTLTKNAVNGIAEFNDVGIIIGGDGYTLTAASGSLTGAASNPFNVASPFIVTNTNSSGFGSLGNAITYSNFVAGTQFISFNIGGTAPFRIRLTAGSSEVVQPVVIDGTTQPGYAGSPLIELHSFFLGDQPYGLKITGGDSTVKGLAINTFLRGIEINGGGGNIIQGNYLGTNAAGNAAIPNRTGIYIINSSNNLIGGATANERNLISGSTADGVEIIFSNNNTVRGNFIGTNAAGTNAVGGISLLSGGSNSIIDNVVSGNAGAGISVQAVNNNIQNNVVGLNAAGTNSLGNGRQGIVVDNGSSQAGGNRLRGNRIFASGGLGIQLSTTANRPILPPLLNDPQDTDTGGNNKQNYPVLTSAASTGGGTTIQGTLNSTPSTNFRLEFFSSPTCDASGNGEGETFIGSTNVITDAGGIVSFTANLPVAVANGRFITATATDATGNTSEFSRCQIVSRVFEISGRATRGGQPLANVRVSLTNPTIPTANRSILTNGSGDYSFGFLPVGDYTLTVSHPNLTFTPPSRSYPNLTQNQTNQNFAAVQTAFSLSGNVLSAAFTPNIASAKGGANFMPPAPVGSFPMARVTLNLSGPTNATVVTNNFGFYDFPNLPPGTYTVTPSKTNYVFTPPSASIVIGGDNQRIDFAAELAVAALTGRIIYESRGGDIKAMNANGSGIVALAVPPGEPA